MEFINEETFEGYKKSLPEYTVKRILTPIGKTETITIGRRRIAIKTTQSHKTAGEICTFYRLSTPPKGEENGTN